MIKFDVESLSAEIKSITDGLEVALGERALRRAGFAGADVFRTQAKINANANRKTGTIVKNIIVKRIEEESDGDERQVYLITVRAGKFNREGDAFYWRFVERGHKFVPRNPRRGKGANWKAHRAAAELEYGSSRVPAYPFMRPAFESHKHVAIEAMKLAVSHEILESLKWDGKK